MTTSSRRVTIVMIEDDVGHARLIEKNIRRAGVHDTIIAFADGASAESYLFGPGGPGSMRSPRGHLILLDLNLPDMSGVDILRRLKQDDHLRRMPVVVLTTTDDQSEIGRCYDIGCNVYMVKPVDYQQFAHSIRQLGLFFSVIQVPSAA
jgi:CheY-like chemotaxis protein